MKRNKIVSKHRVVPTEVLAFCLVLLCALGGNSFAQTWKTVADGVEYAQVRREFSGKAVDINLLRLDLKKVRLDVHHALDRAIGTEKTSSIATRHGAFAAINGGFFRMDNSLWAGEPFGLMTINGRLISDGVGRIALHIVNTSKKTNPTFLQLSGRAMFGIPTADMRVYDPKHYSPLSGVNRERGGPDAVVYTPDFGESTRTDDTGIEFILSECIPRKVLATCYLTLCGYATNISSCSRIDNGEKPGDNKIPRDGYVLSISSGDFRLKTTILQNIGTWRGFKNTKDHPFGVWPNFSILAPGNYKISSAEINNEMNIETDIISGFPQLIRNGKIDITWEQEKASRSFVETRHPRTAVAKLKDGKFLMLTADGRSDQSAGLDLYDLAKYMLELGAVDAMNLDGGGSTTMFIDGKVVNKPSDQTGERKIGDAILVTLRKRNLKER